MNRITICVRKAVTLMEVIFAIGVVMIGLLGLLSILPLAGRRAQESVSLSVGPVIGQQVMGELASRDFLDDGRLRPIRATNSTAVVNLSHSATATVTSFCIDPIFASSNTPPTSLDNGYSAAFFPYYRPLHNPLVDPSTNSTTWPMASPQPRLVRVGIARANSAATLIGVQEALELAESQDDLFVNKPKDKTVSSQFRVGETDLEAVTGGLPYGKRIPRGDFSWIATVNPLPDGQYASVSVVVFKKRIRNFQSPTGTTAPSTPDGNGVGERLAYVTYATGFSGGAGGELHLISNINTVSDLQSNDWMMLSRFLPSGDVVHRWYRVAAVNSDPEEFVVDGTMMTDDTDLGARFPAAGETVWRRKVTLDGSDWSFNFQDTSGTVPVPRAYADDTFIDNTYATIVADVVSVTERTVLITDL